MRIVRIIHPDEIKARHVLMLVLFGLALGAACLFTSAGKPRILPDGAKEWQADSLLLGLVEILDWKYAIPTPQGVAIKPLVHGMAAAVGILIASIGFVTRIKDEEDPSEDDEIINLEKVAAGQEEDSPGKKHIDTTLAAQGLTLAFVCWSFASVFWSDTKEFALGGAILLASQVAWAFALGWGLNRKSAKVAAYIIPVVLFVVSALAILYHGERNPTLRASYPIGNPILLATCLAPGLLISACVAACGVNDLVRKRTGWGLGKIGLSLGALLALGFAFYLSRSRGPAAGVALGAAAIVFFAGGKRIKIATCALVLVGVIVSSVLVYSRLDEASVTGRNATMRTRLYAWSYALDLVATHPVVGLGQGGYVLHGDVYAADDVVDDPSALSGRLTNAHCEWLEVGADLGSVGVVLCVGSIILTLLAGMRAMKAMTLRSQRWTMIGLLSSLVAIAGGECFGVGLRLECVPLLYYTVIGLIWSMSTPAPPTALTAVARRPIGRGVIVIAALVASLMIATYAQRDFAAARAQFEVARAANTANWGKAIHLGEAAARNRLSPQRKLNAYRVLGGAYLQTANFYHDRYVGRITNAQSPEQPGASLSALAQADLAMSRQAVQGGFELLAAWKQACARDFDQGWLAYGLHQLLAEQALFDENEEQAEKHLQAAAASLADELLRRPYDPSLAGSYISVAADETPSDRLLEILARPLRLSRIPTAYLELLHEIVDTEKYANEIAPLVAKLVEQSASPTNVLEQNRWTPEILRISATMSFMRNRYEEAVSQLSKVPALYETMKPLPLLATMSTYAETADASFFAFPDNPQLAIDAAEKALDYMPNSEPGRSLRNALRERLITYHLAMARHDIAHEGFARKQILSSFATTPDEKQLDMVVAEEYVSLSYGMWERVDDATLEEWLKRVKELAPNLASGWIMAADLAVRKNDDSEAARCINKLINGGADGQDILDLLRRALMAMPDSVPLGEIRDELQRAFDQAMQAQQKKPTSQPSEPTSQPTEPTTQQSEPTEQPAAGSTAGPETDE